MGMVATAGSLATTCLEGTTVDMAAAWACLPLLVSSPQHRVALEIPSQCLRHEQNNWIPLGNTDFNLPTWCWKGQSWDLLPQKTSA